MKHGVDNSIIYADHLFFIYLCVKSGQYLVLPAAMKTPSLDIQARAFPQATLMMQQQQSQNTATPAPLNTLSPQSQQFLLMRDLLQVLAGVEGQYIRVAAATAGASGGNVVGSDGTPVNPSATENNQSQSAASVLERRRLGGSASLQRGSFSGAASVGGTAASAGNNGAAAGLPKVSEAHFVIDLDAADRSAANQVSIAGCLPRMLTSFFLFV